MAETTRFMHLQTWVQVPALFITSQVTQGKLFICSAPLASSVNRKLVRPTSHCAHMSKREGLHHVLRAAGTQ